MPGEAGERERIDRELGNWFVCPCVGLVVEDVHGAVPDLEKIDVALVSRHTGLSPNEAEARVTSVENKAVDAAKQAADKASKATAYLSFWTFMALLFGAVAATLSGVVGGELRDQEMRRAGSLSPAE